MRTLEFSRFALCISIAGALLSGCVSGSSMPIAADSTINGTSGLKHHQTFGYTGNRQTFVVPTGVTRLSVVARGAQGGGQRAPRSNSPSGFPGRIFAVIRVHPGDKLYVFVGGSPGSSGQGGGFNGGGVGGTAGSGSGVGHGGGGASDVRERSDSLNDRIIVAAGGGGAGSCYLQAQCRVPGGNGGGLDGKSGGSYGNGISGKAGGGGTQSTGGSGGSGGRDIQRGGDGTPGGDGAIELGGNGGNGAPPGSGSYYDAGYPGGGGGGGYYGGGGGGGSAATGNGSYIGSQGAGGGGGSSYVESSAIKSRMWSAWKSNGDGLVVFSWN
jgi:hypothetical protein